MRTVPVVLGIAALAFSLAACAPEPDPTDPSAPQTSAPADPGEPQSTGEPADEGGDPSTPAADPTCETIIPASVVDEFEKVNWTSREDEFRVGATIVPDGIQCVWGDMTVASDHVQIYGWAPIDADAAAALQAELESQGWLREEEGSTVYITEDPAYALSTDEDGYGMTYEFGDGWVTLADTKQGLLLVKWPPA